MRRNYVTIALAIVAAAVLVLRLHHREHRVAQYGIPTVLVHSCSDKEAFRVLGDDRQIIVTNHPDGAIWINQTPFTSATIGPTLTKIFEFRSLKLAWFIGDPGLTYGQAINDLSALHSGTAEFMIALPTTKQVAVSNVAFSHGESQCPYGL